MIFTAGAELFSGRQSIIRLFLISTAAILTACGGASEKSYDESGKPVWHVETPSVEHLMPADVRRIYARSCATCHGLNGGGIAGVAPDLNHLSQRSPEDWEKYLRHPGGVHPASAMPPVWITADEITAFSKYLTNPNSYEKEAGEIE